MRTQLHYLYDPLCGWCYAAAPLLDAVTRRLPGLPVTLHGGGLFSGQSITPELAAHIREHDTRIAQLSGQTFGETYLQGLLNDPATRLDSRPVIAAILAVAQLKPGSAVAMLQSIQQAHYRHGLKVVQWHTLASLATALGLQKDAFVQACDAISGAPAQRHITATRQLMAQVGTTGFPTFVLETGGRMYGLEHQHYYARTDAFVRQVQAQLEAAGKTASK